MMATVERGASIYAQHIKSITCVYLFHAREKLKGRGGDEQRPAHHRHERRIKQRTERRQKRRNLGGLQHPAHAETQRKHHARRKLGNVGTQRRRQHRSQRTHQQPHAKQRNASRASQLQCVWIGHRSKGRDRRPRGGRCTNHGGGVKDRGSDGPGRHKGQDGGQRTHAQAREAADAVARGASRAHGGADADQETGDDCTGGGKGGGKSGKGRGKQSEEEGTPSEEAADEADAPAVDAAQEAAVDAGDARDAAGGGELDRRGEADCRATSE